LPTSSIEPRFYPGLLPTTDQILSSALHGEALLRARRSELEPFIAELKALARGRDDIRIRMGWHHCGGLDGSPATAYGDELIAAGLLLVSGLIDRDLLLRWLRIGYERRHGNWLSYAPKDTTSMSD
jgi:hypothetical protein